MSVENDFLVASTLNNRDARRQRGDIADLEALQPLTGTQPDLRFGRVQPQSAGSYPVVDVVDASGEAHARLHVQSTGQVQRCKRQTAAVLEQIKEYNNIKTQQNWLLI